MNEGRLKQYLRLIAVSFVAVGCLYFSIDGFLFIHKEVSERLHIARNGILTDGVIVEKSGRGAAAGPFARYSFHVKGYKNPYSAGQQRFLDSMKKLNKNLPPGVPPLNWTALETNRSTVYGEDLYGAFGVPVVPRTKTPVMYLPRDPEKISLATTEVPRTGP